MKFSEFEASLVYRVTSRTARATQRNSASTNHNKEREGSRGGGGDTPLIPALGRQRQADF
jgi:hypothetical protein